MRISLLIVALASAASLPAQAIRTWISGVGDDANPCSRTAPCKTFAGAISKTAAGGEINIIDPGGYGAVTITKSITLSGVSGLASILATGTNGITINAATTDVVILRNLQIKNAGGGIAAPSGLFGVRIVQAKRVEIHDCFIEGGTDYAVNVSGGVVTQLHLSNVRLTSNGGGIYLGATAGTNAVVEDSVLRDGAKGIHVTGPSRLILRNTTVSQFDGSGVLVDGTGSAFLEKSILSGNVNGVEAGPGAAVIRISDLTVTGNTKGLHMSGTGAILSFGNNRIHGNTTEGAPLATVAQR